MVTYLKIINNELCTNLITFLVKYLNDEFRALRLIAECLLELIFVDSVTSFWFVLFSS